MMKIIFLLLIGWMFLHPAFAQLNDNQPLSKMEGWNLAAQSISLLINQNQCIPVSNLATKKIAFLSMGNEKLSVLEARLADYAEIKTFHLNKTETEDQITKIKNQLKTFNLVIFALHSLDENQRMAFGFSKQAGEMVSFLTDSLQTVILVFGPPQALGELKGIEKASALIHSPSESGFHQDITAQIIFGGMGANGKLAEDINDTFKKGMGISSKGGIRFKFTFPEELHINSGLLETRIDSIVENGIREKAFPGCQVLAAKDGRIFFHKTYGFHQYDSVRPVQKTDLYDLASITKITGPLPAIMKLTGEGKLNPSAKFSDYWPAFKNSDKKEITIKEALAHQAGFQAWIPFWKFSYRKNGKFKMHTLKADSSKNYPVKVTEHLWLYKNYQKTFYKILKKTPLRDKRDYLYSCLSFHVYPRIIERLTHINYEDYISENFYKPLGAWSVTYNPLKKFPKEKIIPTEIDSFFRKQLIHGTVHDEGAAMLGGVSGNAGLFSTTLDLAKIMQMYMNKGFYGGEQLIDEKTFMEFNRCQFPENNNRRGLGFDKPSADKKEPGYVSELISEQSFGHTGFTGTLCWADPENGLLFILMTNRVYPGRNHTAIFDLNIRPAIHRILVEAVNSSEQIKTDK